MSEYRSPMDNLDGDRSSSPKRKKIRTKYTPKACVSCRRSKLKCSGENPCQRCIDNGKRCFYSEDQTAAEVLQNLSRPTPTAARLVAMPHHRSIEPRPSDGGAPGLTMEERMARIEAMMDALMHERSLNFPPSAAMEREDSLGFRSDTAFSMPILDPIHPALDHMAAQSPELMQHSILAADPVLVPGASVLVRARNQSMPFPDPDGYQQYLAQFFGDVHVRHPCVDEADFNARTQRVVTNGATEPADIHFLALCYAVFACCDVVSPIGPSDDDKPRGWRWVQLADGLVDKKLLLGGTEDLTLIQYLLFQALYFVYADLPALAYTAMRTTCTALLHQNLHQQSMWSDADVEQVYRRVVVFWNVYISDHTISMSCGRPASLSKEAIDVTTTDSLYGLTVNGIKLQGTDQRAVEDLYLTMETIAIDLAKSLFLKARNAGDKSNASKVEETLMLCSEMELPNPPTAYPHAHLARASVKLKRLNVICVVGRWIMTSLTYEPDLAQDFINFAHTAMKIVHDLECGKAMTPSCQYQLTSIMAGLMLIYSSVILRNHSTPDLNQPEIKFGTCVMHYMDARKMLSGMVRSFPYAKRVQAELSTMTDVVDGIARRWQSLPPQKAVHGSAFVEDLIPSNIIDIIPYRSFSPTLAGPLTIDAPLGEWHVDRSAGSGVLWFL
ncbi:hypothetical protein BDU57DRAFT_523209 [Ampelomyces quisqualis]|uniref:Zn(2)-C6 fungal-type domain-containing protein n=1 Tax=Ampelomyces quisqualis TaxID=50730 RepID=A0A6A5Q926_AMPQU|nr:hypothetical protein BDU57DRAFT_523209 [Ampelomyces quisqualis]